VLRYFWGANPQQLGNLSMSYGKVTLGEVSFPTYNVLVMAASLAIAVGLGLFLQRSRYGRILRATAENREMSEALGANVRWIYASVFTLGTMLGTVGGALVVPTAAASLDMPVELVVEAFAVVVIGGLGSMRGALVGALIVGLTRAAAITFYAELEVLAIYLIVIVVLITRPAGLFGKPVE
jgi:branched-chain amino acid transport system permease protein